MKNKMTTTIDLDQLLADVKKSRKQGKLSEHSVVKLTLEWELDVDESGVEPVPDDDVASPTEDASAAPKDKAASGKNPNSDEKPDWRSTLAQFPND